MFNLNLIKTTTTESASDDNGLILLQHSDQQLIIENQFRAINLFRDGFISVDDTDLNLIERLAWCDYTSEALARFDYEALVIKSHIEKPLVAQIAGLLTCEELKIMATNLDSVQLLEFQNEFLVRGKIYNLESERQYLIWLKLDSTLALKGVMKK